MGTGVRASASRSAVKRDATACGRRRACSCHDVRARGRNARRSSNAEEGRPSCRRGDTIPLGNGTLRVVAMHDGDADQPPTLMVEDVSERGLATKPLNRDARSAAGSVVSALLE